MENLDAVVQERIEKDNDFQATLSDLSDEDKEQAINAKKSEVIKTVFGETEKARQDAEKKFNDQKLRAEKAEQEAKKNKPPVSEEPSLTPKDTLALINAKVHTDDFDSVIEWAKFKKIPVSEALKDKTLGVVLKEKAEERQTALATATSGGQRGAKGVSGEDLLNRASSGQLPESDDDIDKLAEARWAAKKK